MSKARLKFIEIFLTDVLEPFQYIRKVFSGEKKDIHAPEGFTLQVHSPEIDGELRVDGEVFIE